MRIALFVTPMIIVLLALEFYVRSLHSSYRQKEQWMEEHASEVEVLLLGNSHGLFGLRPEVFPKKTYNLCNVSQIFEYDEFLLRRFLPKCSRLTDVFLIVDNSNLFDPPLEVSEDFRCTYYHLYMHYPKHSILSKYGFELTHIEAFKEKLIHGGESCDSLGWNASYSKSTRDISNLSSSAVQVAIDHHSCKDWNYAETNRQALVRIRDLCRQFHVRLILLQAPVTHSYYYGVSQRQRDYLNNCCDIDGVVRADYSLDENFNEDDFYDPDHLVDTGALKWSKLICDSFL